MNVKLEERFIGLMEILKAMDILGLVSGLVLFMFGMNVMGDALEKKAGGSLNSILAKLTSNRFKGFLLGAGVTAVIQSSSATTVMVVGFVNSGVMALRQAIGVIMGANVGTTITSWVLSLSGLEGDAWYVQMFKPATFTPVLAVIGLVLYMFIKKSKHKDTGLILLGFAVLMFGMDMMSGAVAGLKDVPAFGEILLMFSNPLLGVLAGALLTAIIQSSSASVGILQALSATGQITFGSAIPIIMGQNIGTCVTALISSAGATKNAKRAAMVHLYFNIIGTVVCMALFYGVNAFFDFGFVTENVSAFHIAILHSIFNVGCTVILLPFAGLLEKLACLTIKDAKEPEQLQILDERLLGTPGIAIDRCRTVAIEMAQHAIKSMKTSMGLLANFDEKVYEEIIADENEVDMYEDQIGTYLVKLSSASMSEKDSHEVTKILHIIGDFERISDHSVGFAKSAKEIAEKKISFSQQADDELSKLMAAMDEVLELTLASYENEDVSKAVLVEPLEQVIDYLKAFIKRQHIERLQRNECTIELGFILTDIVTTLGRVSDHCSNIAGCLIEISNDRYDLHEYFQGIKSGGDEFERNYNHFMLKYGVR